MRAKVTLDEDVYEVVADLAERSGKSTGEIVSELVRRAIRGPIRPKSRRFPTFDVPDDAPLIPASRVQRLIDEVI